MTDLTSTKQYEIPFFAINYDTLCISIYNITDIIRNIVYCIIFLNGLNSSRVIQSIT